MSDPIYICMLICCSSLVDFMFYLFVSWALTHLFGNGAGIHGTGKIRGFSSKIGKIYMVFMYEVSIARLIPIEIVNLSLFACYII